MLAEYVQPNKLPLRGHVLHFVYQKTHLDLCSGRCIEFACYAHQWQLEPFLVNELVTCSKKFVSYCLKSRSQILLAFWLRATYPSPCPSIRSELWILWSKTVGKERYCRPSATSNHQVFYQANMLLSLSSCTQTLAVPRQSSYWSVPARMSELKAQTSQSGK